MVVVIVVARSTPISVCGWRLVIYAPDSIGTTWLTMSRSFLPFFSGLPVRQTDEMTVRPVHTVRYSVCPIKKSVRKWARSFQLGDRFGNFTMKLVALIFAPVD